MSYRALPCWCLLLAGSLPGQWRDMPALFEREGVAVAYDPVRERVVLFGGRADNVALGDTWEWDGRTWRARRTDVAPPRRYYHRMVYDPSRRTILLFGGSAAAGKQLGDTWEWDGRTWRQLASSGPMPRSYFGIAYDPVRKRVVLFGGFSSSQGNLGDTWEWDGKSWRQIQPTRSPGFLKGCGMQWDPVSRRVVLFGGSNRFVRIPATWTWDGRDWTRISTQGPSVLGEHSDVVWDTRSKRLLVQTQPRSPRSPHPHSTYTFDGQRWVDAKPAAVTQGDFSWSAICEDPARDQVINVHPTPSQGTPLRTSVWNGTKWRVAYDQSEVPNAPSIESVAFDEARDEYVLIGFGMWRLRGTRYEKVAWNTAPLPSNRSVVTYHPGIRKTVLYGYATRWPCRRETWLWDGSRWAASPSATQPTIGCASPRSLIYDSIGDRVLLYEPGRRQVWRWDPHRGWSQVASLAAPNSRDAPSIAFDPIRNRLVMFGGFDPNRSSHFADTWEWDGARWSQRRPKTIPPARNSAPMVHVPELGGVVMAGGWSFLGRDDVWLWDGVDWRRLPDIERKEQGRSPIVDIAYDPGRKELRVFTRGGNGGVLIWALDTLAPSQWHPRPGESLQLGVHLPLNTGEPFAVGLAFDTHPGIVVRTRPGLGVERFPLRADALLGASLAAGLTGSLDAQGRGAVRVPIPNQPWLVGLDIHAAALTLSPSSRIGGITNSVSLSIVR